MKILNLAIFVFLCISLKSHAFDLESPRTVEQIWADSENLSGLPEDMGLRSLMFHRMYLDSKKQLPFALSVSHLTLAIERSLDFGTLDELPFLVPFSQVLKRDMGKWRESLQALNKDMFQRTYLAYIYSKHIATFGAAPTANSENERALVHSVTSILPAMREVTAAVRDGHLLSDVQKDLHFEDLVYWEHAELFQPQMQEVFDQLHWIMRWNLRKIPGPWLEKFLLSPIFHLRSTLNLQCFINEETKLRTSDFMDSGQRIDQARNFYQQLKDISFDPAMFCYNDPYYLSLFPKQLFEDPYHWLSELSGGLLSGQGFPDELKSIGPKHALSTRHSPKRLLKSLDEANLCESATPSFWRGYFSNILDFPEVALMSYRMKAGKGLGRLEMGVTRNALINRAYVELFLEHGKGHKKGTILPYSWLGSAAFGSFAVGKEMLYGMYGLFERNLPEGSLNYFLEEDLEAVRAYMQGYSSLFATAGSFLKTLAKANQAVFEDIYWQFATAHVCGPEKVVELLMEEKASTDGPSRLAWEKMLEGDLLKANLMLLRVEQELVLQPLLYSGVASKYFSYRKIFNRYATAGAPGPEGPLMSFDEYASANNLDNNLYFLDSRIAWVNYLIENHSLYFQQQHARGQLSRPFTEIQRVYNKILGYYRK